VKIRSVGAEIFSVDLKKEITGGKIGYSPVGKFAEQAINYNICCSLV